MRFKSILRLMSCATRNSKKTGNDYVVIRLADVANFTSCDYFPPRGLDVNTLTVGSDYEVEIEISDTGNNGTKVEILSMLLASGKPAKF